MKNLLLFLFLLITMLSYAQQNESSKTTTFKLKEIALLNIEPNNTTVVLNLNSPDFAGEKVKMITANNSTWVNFTSAVSKDSSPRDLSIKIEDGNVPAGLRLKLNTSSYSGRGKGMLGQQSGTITLNQSLQTIVSNIGGAFTGSGINNGYKLVYFLEIHDYKLLDMGNSEVLSISLTISDF